MRDNRYPFEHEDLNMYKNKLEKMFDIVCMLAWFTLPLAMFFVF